VKLHGAASTVIAAWSSERGANTPEEDDIKRSNEIKMPNRKPKATPTPEELELWRLEGLDEAGFFQPRDEEA
jgi:hypothetical protein